MFKLLDALFPTLSDVLIKLHLINKTNIVYVHKLYFDFVHMLAYISQYYIACMHASMGAAMKFYFEVARKIC